MLRAIIGFAAGFVTARFLMQSGSVKKFKDVAKEKAAKVASATGKAASAASREWRRNPDGEKAAPEPEQS
jgi:hypothetical protein